MMPRFFDICRGLARQEGVSLGHLSEPESLSPLQEVLKKGGYRLGILRADTPPTSAESQGIAAFRDLEKVESGLEEGELEVRDREPGGAGQFETAGDEAHDAADQKRLNL